MLALALLLTLSGPQSAPLRDKNKNILQIFYQHGCQRSNKGWGSSEEVPVTDRALWLGQNPCWQPPLLAWVDSSTQS